MLSDGQGVLHGGPSHPSVLPRGPCSPPCLPHKPGLHPENSAPVTSVSCPQTWPRVSVLHPQTESTRESVQSRHSCPGPGWRPASLSVILLPSGQAEDAIVTDARCESVRPP